MSRLALSACGWLAAAISGAAGFGGALLLLPVLALVVGDKSAVPILTVAQLLGNLSRVGFGWRDARWRPALLFCLGAVPASVVGAWLVVGMQSTLVLRLVGVLLFVVVALRHTRLKSQKTPEGRLVVSAMVLLVGFRWRNRKGVLGRRVLRGRWRVPTGGRFQGPGPDIRRGRSRDRRESGKGGISTQHPRIVKETGRRAP